ncbi:MAG: transcription repressor NadR [Blautia sp.]|nr:transcription repressor NadR [Blautia sp.]
MTGSERRNEILRILTESKTPVPARSLADTFQVSRQVIVQDMALLRAQKHRIDSTNRGYALEKEVLKPSVNRVFKVMHTDDQVEEEMNLIVDYGGVVEDVFVYHKVYGILKAELNVRNRTDVAEFIKDLKSGKSGLLKNVTSNYHYHTVTAPTEKLLDLIQEQLLDKGFLAKLQDFEPVDFWK